MGEVIEIDVDSNEIGWEPYMRVDITKPLLQGKPINFAGDQSFLSSINYSVIVNGSPQPSFMPTTGIRQGDPFCPYLLSFVSRSSLAF